MTIDGLQQLLDALKSRGYRVIGPTIRDEAIVYDNIETIAEMPTGWTDEQEAGRYRLTQRGDEAFRTHVRICGTTIELARELGQIPPRCIVYAIEADRFEFGAPLSSAVAAAICRTAEQAAAEIETSPATPGHRRGL